MNLFKKLRYYRLYKKIIKDNEIELMEKYGIHRDWINRLYTTVTFSDDQVGDMKKYDYNFVDSQISKKIKTIDKYFSIIGLTELVRIQTIKPINNLTWGVVFRFKFLKSQNIFFTKLFILLGLIITGILIIVL